MVAALLAGLMLLRCGEDDDGGPREPACEQAPDTSGGTLYVPSIFADVGGISEDLAFDGKGNLYVSLTQLGTIKKVTAKGQVSVVATGLSRPAGLAVAPDGDLYVCEYGAGKLTRVTPAGAATTVATAAGKTAFVNPNHVAINRQGMVYMSDSSGFVARVEGTSSSMLLDARARVPGASPNGLALTADGRTLYVNDLYAKHNIWKVALDAQGQLASVEQMSLSDSLLIADGIALDCKGQLYVTYALTKIALVDPQSGKAKLIFSGLELSTPANMAFGHGAGFDSRTLYIAQLGANTIKKIYTGMTGMVLPSFK